jgi:hypothetical protein
MKKTTVFVILGLFFSIFSAFMGPVHEAKATSLCVINSFYASPSNVNSGGNTNLIISTTGCQNLSLSGGTYTNSQIGNNTSFYVGPVYSNTTYTLTGYDYYNNSTYASTIVTVNGNGNGNNGSCVLNNFYASPTNVSSGGYTTLYWNTSGCSTVNVTGPGVNSYSASNSIQVGPVYGSSVYTITGSSYGYSNNINQTVTVSSDYYGGQNLPAITTGQATSITGVSATLNGFINSNTYNCVYNSYSNNNCNTGNTTYYFQYGTNQFSLTGQTPIQTYSNNNGNISAYVNGLQPYTNYYFRLVITNNYTTKSGDIQQFTTNNVSYVPTPVITYTTPVVTQPTTPVVITRYIQAPDVVNNTNVSSGAIILNITSSQQSVVPGGSLNYVITYQNITNKNISNAMLNVILPIGVIFQQSSLGMATTNNTVVASLGTLAPNQQGIVNISASTPNSGAVSNNLTATANIAYTNSDGSQGTATAYTMNNAVGAQATNQIINNGQSNLGGFAFSGSSGFLPSSLTEWLIIFGIILLLIILSRELTKPKNPPYTSPTNYDHH